ncbi:hypothetical protein BJP25_01855 [Actinokineospora bangkokensis]|uniref:Tyr recombinase domain-containing protein n=1 Tax=Actinokineospora bangkokensis TaxID=1193682 RepID=A0A1Q9LCP9_9PSEU|nr:hypothetical protein BJP25_01855 [Actinokineospora bangkokensis]
MLRRIFSLAVRHDAREDNPVRELSPARLRKAQPKIVLTEDSTARRQGHLRTLPYTERHDLPDFVTALSGVGCRIGELLALDWSWGDFEAGTVRFEGTATRIACEGLAVQPHTKTSAGMRTIKPPRWGGGVSAGTIRAAVVGVRFPVLAGHAARPQQRADGAAEGAGRNRPGGAALVHVPALVADRLNRAGLSAREIADYLVHSNVHTTQEVQLACKVVGHAAAGTRTEIRGQSIG